MNLSAKGRKLLGAFGLGRSAREERQVTDTGGGSAQCAATLGNGFSKTDEIMNTKTSNMWLKGLAVLALTSALANTALGQEGIVWPTPADMTYGQPLTATQLNARFFQNGQDITDQGVIRYFWDQEVTASEEATNVDRRSGGWVALSNNPFIGQFSNIGYDPANDGRDKDPNTDGTQLFDWLFLDAGNHTVRAVFLFDNENATPNVNDSRRLDRTIKVNKAPLAVVPKTLNREYGEENFTGYESDLLPTYPNGNLMYRLHANPNQGGLPFVNNPNNNTPMDAAGNDANGDPVGSIEFDLDGNGNRILIGDSGANTPLKDYSGNDITIPVVGENDNSHYSRNDGVVTFSGFVRDENYNVLFDRDPDFTSVSEGGDPNNLPQVVDSQVETTYLLNVTEGNSANQVFRSANVGATGVIAFRRAPAFKNYSVQTGANGTLTVSRAEIKFSARSFNNTADDSVGTIIDDNQDGVNDQNYGGNGKNRPKIYGDGISLLFDHDQNAGNDDVVNPALLRSSDFSLNNNFRLGEAHIESSLGVTAPGVAGDAPVGTTDINLFLDTSDLPNNVDFLNNYNLVFENGVIQTIARKIELTADDKTRNYGDGDPSFTFKVKNVARHHLKAPGGFVINGVYTPGQLVDDFFSTAPTLNTPAGFDSNVGTYDINIGGAAANNYTVDKNNKGTLTVNQRNLLIQVQNGSSVVNTPASLPEWVAFGLVLSDQVSVTVNRPKAGILNTNPSLIFRTAAGDVETGIGAVDDAVGNFKIEIQNKSIIRATNYRIFFNDAYGAFDGLQDPKGSFADGNSPGIAVTQNSFVIDPNNPVATVGGKNFIAFTGNEPAAPINATTAGYRTANPLFTTGNTDIGRYTVTNRTVDIVWNTPTLSTFGDTLGGRLNATFINPDTNLIVTDQANGAQQLALGANFDVKYFVKDGGTTIKSNTANGGNEIYTRLTVGTHRIVVEFNLHTPPQGLGFGGIARAERDITVVPRSVRIKADNKARTFGQSIPDSNDFNFWSHSVNGDDLPPAANYANGQDKAGNPLNGTFVGNEIVGTNRRYTTTATANSPAGKYPITLSGFTSGNINFNFEAGELTINKQGSAVTWNTPASIVYGTPLSATQLNATGPEGTTGITYDKAIGTILAAGQHNVKATYTAPSGSNVANAELIRTITVTRRPLIVGAQDTTKVFGDDNPSFVPTADSLANLVDGDNITLTFRTTATAKSNVGKYDVEPQLADPNGKIPNYDLTINTGTLEVTKRAVVVTPSNRTMGVGRNPSTELNNFFNKGNVDSNDYNGNSRPGDFLQFSNLASFHTIANNKRSENKPEAFTRLNTLFSQITLSTTATINSAQGETFPVSIAVLTPSGTIVNGAKAAGNYTFSFGTGNVQIDPLRPTITWGNATITYGQAVHREGVERAKINDGNRTQSVDIFDAVVGNNDPSGGTFTYEITDSGPLLDGVVFNAGAQKLKVTWDPPASAPRYGQTSKEMTLTINKRRLIINIEDNALVDSNGGTPYGSIDRNFNRLVRVGIIREDRGDGTFEPNGNGSDDGHLLDRQADSPIRLVNGDTLDSLDTQLVLFSNVQPDSPAGDYFVGVAQSPEDRNYAIDPIFANNRLFDGITANGTFGLNINGIGGLASRTGETGPQMTFNDRDGNDGTRNTLIDLNNPTSIGPVEFHAARFTVLKAPLTLTAKDVFHDQGEPFSADRGLAGVMAGEGQLKNGDTLDTALRTVPLYVSSVNENSVARQDPYLLQVTGASSDNYIVSHRPGNVFVQLPPAPVVWTPNPSSIVFGTALNADQLNPASTASGSFLFSPAAGTVLPAGSQELTAIFTPSGDDALLFRNTTVTASLEVTKAPLTVTANNIERGFLEENPPFSATFDGFVNGDDEGVFTLPLTFQTDGVAGVDSGSYPLTPGSATADNYDISFVPGVVNVAKAAATVSLSGLDQVADGNPKQATVVTDPVGLGVNVTYNSSSVLPTEPGTYEVRAIVNDPNYQGFAIATLSLSGTGAITITDLVQTFDGTPRPATIATSPIGLNTVITYNGNSAAPVNAGTYEVRVVVDDPVFSGFAIDVLEIQPAEAQVNFDLASLVQPVNNLTGAGVSTVPAGLNVEVFYGDVTALPTEIGSVPVRAVINEPNYVGQTSGTFEVARAEQSITTFPFPTFTLSGAPINVGLFATASSGLPVTFSVVSGNGTVSGNTLTVSQPGDVIVLASQAGDDFWAPGSSTFTITATGQGVPTQAPQVSFGGVSDGGLVINVTGAPSATVKILSTAVIGSPLSEVATVTLDASGNGSVTIPTDQAAGYFTASN